MLTGWPPFYDKNLRKMCEQILKSDLAFPSACSASAEARDLIRGLLMRDPAARLGSRAGGVDEIKRHAFFAGLDWDALERREVEPPFKPTVASETDITNFDATFTSEPAELTPPDPSELGEDKADEFADFSFVNASNLKSTLESMFGLGSAKKKAADAAAAAAAAGAGAGAGADDDDAAAAAGAGSGAAAAAPPAAGAGDAAAAEAPPAPAAGEGPGAAAAVGAGGAVAPG
jgi:hypothetical protein